MKPHKRYLKEVNDVINIYIDTYSGIPRDI